MKTHAFVAMILCVFAGFCLLSCDDAAGKPQTPGDGDGDSETTEAAETEEDIDHGPLHCTDSAFCPQGSACDPIALLCRECQCSEDSDCRDYSTSCLNGCSAAMACYDCLCIPAHCAENNDCPQGYVCDGGTCCGAGCYCPTESSCRIDLPYGFVTPQTTILPDITVFTQGGAIIPVDNSAATWNSSDAAVFTVGSDGTVTGGNTGGTAAIRAMFGNVACEATLTNTGAVPLGQAQVWVTDADTNALIDGATVMMGGTSRTTQGGLAMFPATAQTFDVHVFHKDFSALSLFAVTGDQVIAPLYPRRDISRCGGAKGEADFSKIPEALKEEIRIAATGFSLKEPLLDMGLHRMLGFDITTHVHMGSVVDTDVIQPSGVEAFVCKNPVHQGFLATGTPGERILWSFGGYLPLSDIISIVTDNMDHPYRLDFFAPFLDTFYSGLRPGLTVQTVPRVIDADDLDNNGDTEEMVCDIGRFQDMGSIPSLNQPLNGHALLTLPPLPENAGLGALPGAAMIMFADARGQGMAPLGIALACDENEKGVLDGLMGDAGTVDVHYGLQHSGVTGYDYVFVAMAFDLEDSFRGKAMNFRRTSVQTRRFTGAPTDIPLEALLPIGPQTYNPAGHSFTALPPGAATLQHFSLHNDEGDRWDVWAPADTGGVLPALPRDFKIPLFSRCNSNSIDGGDMDWQTLTAPVFPDVATLQRLDLRFTQRMEELDGD